MTGNTFRLGEAKRLAGRLAAVALSAHLLAACAVAYAPDALVESIRLAGAEGLAEEALSAMVRGDLQQAESLAERSLSRDPTNPYALLVAGVVYQNSGRHQKARMMYEEVLVNSRVAPVAAGAWSLLEARTVQDVAAENLRHLGGIPPMTASGLGSAGAATPQASLPPALTRAVDVAALPASWELGAEAWRFRVLKDLEDAGLITGDEFQARRAANLGALLPLTQQPPARNLDRPVPDSVQVAARLRALGQAFESRAISPTQHALERTTILDALLPVNPQPRAVARPGPADVLAAAEMIGRVTRLQEERLITADEAMRERRAIESALRSGGASSSAPSPAPAVAPTPAARPPAPAAPAPAAAASQTPSTQATDAAGDGNPAAVLRTGRQPLQILPSPEPGQEGLTGVAAVHLASFQSEDAARAGWAELQHRFSVLQGLELRVTRVSLAERGTFYRVNAAPLADRAAALALWEYKPWEQPR